MSHQERPLQSSMSEKTETQVQLLLRAPGSTLPLIHPDGPISSLTLRGSKSPTAVSHRRSSHRDACWSVLDRE